MPADTLLDPKNDYVFFRVFSEEPDPIAARISAWVTFFEHWREEQIMADIDHAPIQDALNRVRQLSADEQATELSLAQVEALRANRTP